MEVIIKIDNLKCGGCAATIKKGLRSFPEIQNVKVDKEMEQVSVTYSEGITLDVIKERLKSMGYPERGSTDGFGKFAANAKSYVSCAIGKLSKEKDDE